MSLVRVMTSAGLIAGLKVTALGLYIPWGLKILLDADDPDLMFNGLALALSIFGLWALITRICDWIERTVGGPTDLDADDVRPTEEARP